MARVGNTTNLANASVNVQANALAALLDGGSIDVMDGPRPDAADLPIDTQTVGVTLGFGNPAFRPAVAGVIVSNLIQPGVVSTNITPTWARMFTADGRAVMDISVGVRDSNLIIQAEYLEQGATLACDSYTHVIAKSVDRSWKD